MSDEIKPAFPRAQLDEVLSILDSLRSSPSVRERTEQIEQTTEQTQTLMERLISSREPIPSQRRRVVEASLLQQCSTACTPCMSGLHGVSKYDEQRGRVFALCGCGRRNKLLKAISKMRLPAGAQRFTLEDYDWPPGLEEMLSVWSARATAEEREQAPALILTGPPGTGKTHLMVGLALALTLRGQRAAYVEAHHYRSLLSSQMDKAPGWELIDPLEQLQGARALFLDEIGMQKGDYERREINRIIHESHAANRPICIASNLSPRELGLTGEDGYLNRPIADRLRGASDNGEFFWQFAGPSRR